MIARLVSFLLSHAKLSQKGRLMLVNSVIHRLGMPTRSILAVDENRRIVVNGQPLSLEQSESIQQGATALLRNPALKLIRDQIRFSAIDRGYLQNTNSDRYQDLFYKAALLYAQEEQELTRQLAGEII